MKPSINILLLGITGDLAKLKILPAIGQLTFSQRDKYSLKLFGQSRSEADKNKIIDRINLMDQTSFEHLELNLIQKNYTDPTVLIELLDKIEAGEKLIIYFALPPSVITDYLKMIENLDEKLFVGKNIDLLLEKPFGRNLEEAKNIIDLIGRVKKKVKVSFIDHYLFKNQSQIIEEQELIKLLKSKKIEPSVINIETLETVDVDNRLGYYIDSGAIDDMTPHLLSLLLRFLKLFKITNFQININSVSTGQYSGLADKIKALDETKLNLETFFEVKADLVFDAKVVDLKLTSGKKLIGKKTELEGFLSDNSQLVWDISGKNQIVYSNSGDSTLIHTLVNSNLDHLNMFLQVINGYYNNFITNDEVITGHNLITKIKEFVHFNEIKVEVY